MSKQPRERNKAGYLAQKEHELLAAQFFGGGDDFERFGAEFGEPESAFRARVFSVQATTGTYRLLHTWDEAGLLDPLGRKKRPGRGWRRFSIYDLARLKIFSALRRFGVPLSKLQNVNIGISVRNLQEGDALESREERDGLLLHYLWIRASLGDDPILAVFEDGSIGAGMRDQYLAAMDVRGWPAHVALPLTTVFRETLPSFSIPERRDVSAVLAPEEWHLLSRIRSGRYRRVTVAANRGKVERLKLEEEASFPKVSKRKTDLLIQRLQQSQTDFEELMISSRNGRKTFVRRTRSVKP